MLNVKNGTFDIITQPAMFSVSQWLPFQWYDWLPKWPRYNPNPYMMSPWSFFRVYISWHNKYETVYPHSKKYRMLRAISTNNLNEVVKILEQGFPLDEPLDQKYGYNPLQIAAINNHYPLIQILTLRGADINKKDRWGNTPLHLAINHQNHEAINSLMKNGSDPNIENKYGISAKEKSKQSPNIYNFISQYQQQPRKFPKFRVKLKLQQRLKSPFWQQMSNINIYSGKVKENHMSKWQFDFTDHRTVKDIIREEELQRLMREEKENRERQERKKKK